MRTDRDNNHVSALALAERVAHYAKVRLCDRVDGSPGYNDWLLSERDRYLICRALRAFEKQEE